MFKCMNNVVNVLFVLFNIVIFAINFALVDFFPKTLLMGWCPSQLGVFVISMILAAIVWGLYFVAFFNTQGHVQEKYSEEGQR